MQVLVSILLLLFLPITSLLAQNSSIREYPMKEKSLLWEVSGKDVKEPCYLFGTMHLIEKEFFYFPRKLKRKIKKSDALMLELAGLSNSAEAMKFVFLKEGSLFDFFSEEENDTIINWAKNHLGMNESAFRSSFSSMKPFAVMQVALQIHFVGKTESYELSLYELAEKKNIEVKGLETVEQQMTLFDNLTDDQQAEMLLETIRNIDLGIETIKEMENLYSQQDIDALYEYITSGGGIIEEEKNQFLDQRNKNWIPKIEYRIAQSSTFIAVGAGHLGGPNGIIRLLENKGYTLTPIKL